MSERILDGVVAGLRERVDLEATHLERITIGESALMVELDDVGDVGKTAGLAHRPPGQFPDVPDDPSALIDEARQTGHSRKGDVRRAIGMATLNALSAPFVSWRAGDPMALLEPDVSTIATVGLFRPAFRKFSHVDVHVIERQTDREPPAPDTLPEGVRVSMHGPDEAAEAMADAEVVFVTGSAFCYGGVDRYLDVADGSATIVLIGATASFLPEPAFAAGVDVLAGASVENHDGVRVALEAGGCGTKLHDAGVRKGYVSNERPTGIALQAGPNTDVDGSDAVTEP